ncbi:MAG: hypothetical protein AAFX51_17345, partial [Cyanobacteria bacterium J06636_28]
KGKGKSKVKGKSKGKGKSKVKGKSKAQWKTVLDKRESLVLARVYPSLSEICGRLTQYAHYRLPRVSSGKQQSNRDNFLSKSQR